MAEQLVVGEKDRRGTVIHVGDKVAYNHSGQVGHGEVVGIVKGTRYGRSSIFYKVKNLDGHGWQPTAGYSKVMSNLNLLVLEE